MYRHLLNIKIFLFKLMGGFIDRVRISRDKRIAAETTLLRLRPMSMQECVNLMKEHGFRWTTDPLKGKFDYVSEPWFTLCRKGGDCDDFAEFWTFMCTDYPSVQFGVITDNLQHRMVCFRMEGEYYIASNMAIELKLNPKDINIVSKFGEILDFEGAVKVASKMLYKDSLRKIRMISPSGYVTKIIKIDNQ